MLHISLLNTTVVTFKVHPLGSYVPIPAPSPSFKTIMEPAMWNRLKGCRCILMSSKCPPFNISYISGTEESHWGLDPVNRQSAPTQLFV